MLNRLGLLNLAACLLLLPPAAFAGDDEKPAAAAEFSSTHKQVRVIRTMHKEQPIRLHTFCLDRDGNILACVGARTRS
ncbi:MAG UNVERIFIED_CONTAM: hypothetical protein LVR18_23455 [Planctomycetaceae bacterium]|jgi:hypothetical protein